MQGYVAGGGLIDPDSGEMQFVIVKDSETREALCGAAPDFFQDELWNVSHLYRLVGNSGEVELAVEGDVHAELVPMEVATLSISQMYTVLGGIHRQVEAELEDARDGLAALERDLDSIGHAVRSWSRTSQVLIDMIPHPVSVVSLSGKLIGRNHAFAAVFSDSAVCSAVECTANEASAKSRKPYCYCSLMPREGRPAARFIVEKLPIVVDSHVRAIVSTYICEENGILNHGDNYV